jgi:hypothetical protein
MQFVGSSGTEAVGTALKEMSVQVAGCSPHEDPRKARPRIETNESGIKGT